MRRSLLIILLLLTMLQATAADSPSRPYGLSSRTPWTTGRITGSPEPPAPFRTERAYPNLTFKNPLDIAFAPGLPDRVFVVEQSGKIFSFPLSDENRTKPDLLL